MIDYFIHTPSLQLLYAALLGVLVALNPCQIAICLSALTATTNKNNVVGFSRRTYIFSFGRLTTYLLLGSVLYFCGNIISDGLLSSLTEIVESITPYICIVFSIFFFIRTVKRHHHHDNCHNSGSIIKKQRHSGVFALGLILAFIFCPESALIYFGLMIPLAISSCWGWMIVILFSFFAVLPLVVIARLCNNSKINNKDWEKRLERFQFYINMISAIILGIIAVAMFII